MIISGAGSAAATTLDDAQSGVLGGARGNSPDNSPGSAPVSTLNSASSIDLSAPVGSTLRAAAVAKGADVAVAVGHPGAVADAVSGGSSDGAPVLVPAGDSWREARPTVGEAADAVVATELSGRSAGSRTLGAYTFSEEVAHSLTHGIGAVLAIIGLCVLVARSVLHGGQTELIASSIFGSALVLMYTASTLFHSIPLPRAKHVFRVLDHCLIYVLIAATYTPFTLIALRNTEYGWPLFVFVWTLAALGIVFKAFTTGRFEWLSIAIYLGMGWCGLVAIQPMLSTIPTDGLWLLLAGGLAYSFGTIFYSWPSLRYHHAIWHLFVLAGSAFHYFSVLFYVLPGPGAATGAGP